MVSYTVHTLHMFIIGFIFVVDTILIYGTTSAIDKIEFYENKIKLNQQAASGINSLAFISRCIPCFHSACKFHFMNFIWYLKAFDQ